MFSNNISLCHHDIDRLESIWGSTALGHAIRDYSFSRQIKPAGLRWTYPPNKKYICVFNGKYCY